MERYATFAVFLVLLLAILLVWARALDEAIPRSCLDGWYGS